jgi:hypothetical protein
MQWIFLGHKVEGQRVEKRRQQQKTDINKIVHLVTNEVAVTDSICQQC